MYQGIYGESIGTERKNEKSKTRNNQRERKNEEKKKNEKRQGCPGGTMLTTWVSTGRMHHDDDGHTQAFIALTGSSK